MLKKSKSQLKKEANLKKVEDFFILNDLASWQQAGDILNISESYVSRLHLELVKSGKLDKKRSAHSCKVKNENILRPITQLTKSPIKARQEKVSPIDARFENIGSVATMAANRKELINRELHRRRIFGIKGMMHESIRKGNEFQRAKEMLCLIFEGKNPLNIEREIYHG